jgi:uncharacterized membrane protein YsdA (DUF1294 family)/cold shock CspA family protein
MRIKGKIASWNDDKAYGFIEPYAGGGRVFVHIKAFGNRSRRPEVNQVVTFTLSSDNQGRACAVKATLAGDPPQREARRQAGSLSIVGATAFLLIVGIAVATAKVPPLILGLYIVASLVTFTAYAFDKSAAKEGTWRTQESTLHLLSLVGGWPGALVAQQKLRHKSKKQSFRTVFWITVMLNCAAFGWLFTSTGAATLRLLLANITRG